MKKIFTSLSLFVAISFSFQKGNAQLAGSLDTTFNHTGKVTTVIEQYNMALAVALQTDGKIVAAGTSSTATTTSFALARYDSTGNLDGGFGTGGKVSTYLGPNYFSSQAQAVAIQNDGKIVAAGYATGGSGEFVIARYLANGNLDSSSFGMNGLSINIFGGHAYAVAIQPDGKIVAAGGYFGFCVARYDTNGSPDHTFGTGVSGPGVVTTTIGSNATAYAVSIQADGKIVAAGSSQNGTSTDLTLVRYNIDGSIDSTFGTNGITTSTIGSTSTAYAISIQTDGKIVVAGSSGINTASVFALGRFTTNGNLDNNFGTGGTTTIAIGSAGSYAHGLSIQADGKVVVAGYSGNGFAVTRFSDIGFPDSTFGTNGIVTTAMGSSGNIGSATAVSLQTNGKIVVAGYTGVLNSSTKFALARYNDISSTTDIPDYSEETLISIYPNPSPEKINIISSQIIEMIRVTDMQGREIPVTYAEMQNVTLILPVQEGIYFIHLKSKGGTTVRKVIKTMQ